MFVTSLRKVILVGPKLGPQRWLWAAELSADLAHDLEPDGGFMRNASLRVAAETAEARAGYRAEAGSVSLRDPRLLHLAVRPERGDELRLGPRRPRPPSSGEPPRSISIEDLTAPFGIGRDIHGPRGDTAFAQVSACPDLPDGRWPDKVSPEIESAPLALLTGAVPVSLRRGDPNNGLAEFLDVRWPASPKSPHSAGLLGGAVTVPVHGMPANRPHIVLRLTRDGVEIPDATIADPFGRTGTVACQLRLAPGPGEAIRLVLAGIVAGSGGAERIRAAINGLVAASRQGASPVVFDVSPSPTPPLYWQLHRPMDSGVQRAVEGGITSPHLMPGSLRASLVTESVGRGREASVASLAHPDGRFATADGTTVMTVTAGPAPPARAPEALLIARRDRGRFTGRFDAYLGTPRTEDQIAGAVEAALAGAPVDLTSLGDVPMHVDTDRLHADLSARYRARGLVGGGVTDLSAFVTLERGVVQMPVPAPARSPGRGPVPAPVADPAQQAFAIGLVHASLADDRGTLTLSSATYAEARISVTAGETTAAALRFADVVGDVTGALWLSEASPSPASIVPTLDGGPSAARAVEIAFGLRNPTGGWSGMLGPVRRGLPDTVALRVRAGAVVGWTPWTNLALVAATPMTRTAPSATLPSTTADLVPTRHVAADATPVTVRLRRPSGGALPQATIEGGGPSFGWPGIAGGDARAVTLVPLDAPGLEVGPVSAATAQPGLRASLRFDLPLLGGLFAAGALPRATAAISPDAVALPAPTALDWTGLQAAWAIAAEGLARTRTQSDRATGWSSPADAVTPTAIATLVEGATWTARVGVRYAPGGGWPRLEYSLANADGEPDWVSGEAALRGYRGPAALSTGGTVEVTGFAVAPRRDEDGRRRDTRGFALAERATSVPDAALDPSAKLDLRDSDLAGDRRLLVTTRQPVAVAVGASPAELWLRDLPMVERDGGLTFDPAGTPELAGGPDLTVFDRERLPRSVYEWRLFAPATGQAASYAIRFGPLRLRPLRLLALTFDRRTGAAQGLTVLVAVDPPRAEDTAPGESFGHEDLYVAGTVVALRFEAAAGILAPVAIANLPAPDDADDPANRLGERLAALARAIPAGLSVEVAFDLAVAPTCAGSPAGEERAARLTFQLRVTGGALEPVAGSARLVTRLLGRRVALEDGALATAGGEVAATFRTAMRPGNALVLGTIAVVLAPDGARFSFEASLSLDDRRDPADASRPGLIGVVLADRPVLRWLGATAALPANAWRFDHERGTFALTLDAVPAAGLIIRGLPVPAEARLDATVLVVLGEDLGAGGPAAWPVASAYAEVTLAAGDGLRVRHRLSRAGARGTATHSSLTVHASGDEDSALRTSTIAWPVDALGGEAERVLTRTAYAGQESPPHERPSGKAPANVVLRSGTAPLRHRVAPLIRGAVLDTALLGPGGGAPVLARPWRLKVAVVHEIVREDRTLLNWTSVDDVAVVDLAAYAAARAAGTADYAYSPRYRQAGETDRARREAVPSAGIVRDGPFGSGIDGLLVAAAGHKDPAERPWEGLAVLGGGVLEVPFQGGESGVLLALPWIATLLRQCGGDRPLRPLDTLPQAPGTGNPVRVSVAAFDLAAGIPFAFDGTAPVPLDIGSASVPEVGAALTSAFGPEAAEPWQVADRAFASNLPGLSGAAPVPDRERPLFWRTLMALARIAREQGIGRVRSVAASRAPGRSGSFEPRRGPGNPAGTDEGGPELVCLDRETPIRIPVSPGEAGASEGSGGSLAEAPSRAARLAAARLTDPRLLCLVDPKAARRYALVELGPEERVRSAARLRAAANTVFPSAALGWPIRGALADAAGRALVLGAEQVLQDADHAWSGRARRLGARAQAMGADHDLGRATHFLALGRRVLFDRALAAAAAPAVIAPADRSLAPVPARVRVPRPQILAQALALNRLPEARDPALAPLLPGRFETVTTGARPGILTMEHEGVLCVADDRCLDGRIDRFGRAADRGPTVWRQGRTPRSTGLPRGRPLAETRRTWIGENYAADGRLTPFVLLRGAAAILRYASKPEAGSGAESLAMSLQVAHPALGRLAPGFDGTVRLLIRHPGQDPTDLRRLLAQLGLFRAGMQAHLLIGAASLPFATAGLPADAGSGTDGEGVILTLMARRERLGPVLAALGAADADTRASLVLKLARDDWSAPSPSSTIDLAATAPDGLVPGPPRTLVLPLPLVPGDRAWLPIETATLAFGDPAYDRELGGPAKVVSGSGEASARLLALDRRDYDLDATILFAFGTVNPRYRLPIPVGAPFEPTDVPWTVRIEVLPRAVEGETGPKPERRRLRLLPGEDAVQAADAQAYAIVIRSLLEEDDSPACLAPGERLAVAATTPDGKELKAEVGIAAEPVIAPPAAVYALITRDRLPQGMAATAALHAIAPLPQTVEYPDLVGDLVKGHVRRRALFLWRFSPRTAPAEAEAYAGLVKIDRTGGGQIPEDGDFQPFG